MSTGSPVTTVPVPTGPNQLSALPITHYELTAAQQAVLTNAEAALVHSCMEQLGLDYTLPVAAPSSGTDDLSGDLPDNDPALAATQGYRDRSVAAAQIAYEQRSKAAAPVSPRITTALLGASTPWNSATPDGGCLGQARRTIAGAKAADPDVDFDTPQLVTNIQLNSYFAALADGRVKDVFGAWSACMKARGFDYPSPVAAVDDPRWKALQPATALEIRTATADVSCKYQHNVDGVFHAVQVADENTAIDANLGALQQIRAGLDSALATATRIEGQPAPGPSGGGAG